MDKIRDVSRVRTAMNADHRFRLNPEFQELVIVVSLAAAIGLLSNRWIVGVLAGVSCRGISVLYAKYRQPLNQRIAELELEEAASLLEKARIKKKLEEDEAVMLALEKEINRIVMEKLKKIIASTQNGTALES